MFILWIRRRRGRLGRGWGKTNREETRNSFAKPLRPHFLCGENCLNHDLGGIYGINDITAKYINRNNPKEVKKISEQIILTSQIVTSRYLQFLMMFYPGHPSLEERGRG